MNNMNEHSDLQARVPQGHECVAMGDKRSRTAVAGGTKTDPDPFYIDLPFFYTVTELTNDRMPSSANPYRGDDSD